MQCDICECERDWVSSDAVETIHFARHRIAQKYFYALINATILQREDDGTGTRRGKGQKGRQRSRQKSLLGYSIICK